MSMELVDRNRFVPELASVGVDSYPIHFRRGPLAANRTLRKGTDGCLTSGSPGSLSNRVGRINQADERIHSSVPDVSGQHEIPLDEARPRAASIVHACIPW